MDLLTLTFKLRLSGVAVPYAGVMLSMRAASTFIVEDWFEMKSVQSAFTDAAGDCVFQVYASPDLVALGFGDGYYRLQCEQTGLDAVFWVPAQGDTGFSLDLSALVALAPPGVPTLPPGAAPFYTKAEVDALLDEIRALIGSGGGTLTTVPNGALSFGSDVLTLGSSYLVLN